MFIQVTVIVNKKEQETFIVKSKVLGVGVSPDLGLTYILSDTGHCLIVKESLLEIKQMLDKPIKLD